MVQAALEYNFCFDLVYQAPIRNVIQHVTAVPKTDLFVITTIYTRSYKMNRFVSVVLIILIFEIFTGRKANADLVIDLGPNGFGGLTMSLTGTGNTSTTTAGASITYGTATDTFLPNGFDPTAAVRVYEFTLSGNHGSYVQFIDRNGLYGNQSEIEIGGFGGSFPGSSLSTLTGTYDLPFVTFTPNGLPPLIAGTYVLTRSDGPGFIDVGNVTLRISSVPEPSSFVLFGLAVMFAIAISSGFVGKKDGIREIARIGANPFLANKKGK